jgi:hypothetical protein
MKTSNHRPGVGAGWRVLFAFQRARPRATQAGRWPRYSMKNRTSNEHGRKLLLCLLGLLGIASFSFGQGAKPEEGALRKGGQAQLQRIRIEVVRAVGVYSRTNHTISLHLALRVVPVSPASGISIYNDWQTVAVSAVEPYVVWIPTAQTAGSPRWDENAAIPIDEGGTIVEWVLLLGGMSPKDIHRPITARIRYQDRRTESPEVVAPVRLVQEGN